MLFRFFYVQIDLVITIEDESIEDFIPAGTEEGLRELLLACLQKEPGKVSVVWYNSGFLCNVEPKISSSILTEKRVPASILLESPWFDRHGIHDVSDAVAIMHRYFEETTNQEREA